MRNLGRRSWTAAACAILGASSPLPTRAQSSVQDLASSCAASNALLAAPCLNAALVLGVSRAGLGVAAAQGSAVPGSASTLGRRMASSPRLAFSLRGGMARARYADPGTGAAVPEVRSMWPRSAEGQVAVGVLEGWSLLPTVGGFLSLDLLGTLGVVSPGGSGFEGSVHDVGYGARVGLFRESFTLPGVSGSLQRRHLGDVAWGPETGDGTRVAYTPVVTSLRATASKDLLSFGVLGGWGWDRYEGRSSVTVRRTGPGGVPVTAQATVENLRTDRQLFFGGLSYTLLVLQLSGEAGWARAFSAPAGPSGRKPTGSPFGSLAARLTY